MQSSADRNQQELEGELQSGEDLLWIGQPLRNVIFHASDWLAIPFSFMWGGFAIYWEGSVTGFFGSSHSTGGALNFFVLWSIPFVLAGQYLIWGRFLYTAWRKGHTHYAVTTKRVLVVNSGGRRKVLSGYLSSLHAVTLTIRQDGVGTLTFSPEPSTSALFGAGKSGSRGFGTDIDLSRLAFFDIADARKVYTQIEVQRGKQNLRASEMLGMHM